MRARRVVVAIGMGLMLGLVLAPMARADWDFGTPYKWLQLPNLSQTGMDVNATWMSGATGAGQPPFIKVLADDFLCTQTGPITDVHIWGSWLRDQVGQNVLFKLSVHADVPANVDAPYSHPGQELWSRTFQPAEYLVRPWATAPEQFFEPNTNQIIGSDTQVFQYNFSIQPTDAFVQQGTAALPQVYWLDVQAMTTDGTVFGWKTSTDHWNDDAVFADTAGFGGPPIGPMPSPVYWEHLIDSTGQSLDMAFVITPEPATLCLLGLGGLGVLLRKRK